MFIPRVARSISRRSTVSHSSYQRIHTSRRRPSMFVQEQTQQLRRSEQRVNRSPFLFHQVRFHGDDEHVAKDAADVKFSYIAKDGTEIPVVAKVGQNLLRVAQRNDVELEGACECSIACSTCHVILEGDIYDILEEPTEDEEDMLDMAFGLTETSRLGCQVLVQEEMEGMKVVLPKATRNFYVDGHVPQPH